MLSLLVLMVAFRSVVIPAISAVATLLSTGAAYGVIVAVFQWGWLGRGIDNGATASDAVASGLARTGRIITSAAAIMISVFTAFVLGDLRVLRVIGLGMAAAVLLDATLVRMVATPAVLRLTGQANWWFPRRFDRAVPDLLSETQGHPRRPCAGMTPDGEARRGPCRSVRGRPGLPSLGAAVGHVGRLHREQFDPELLQPAEQPVQLGLVSDVAGQHGPVGAVFQDHPVEGGLEAFAEPAAQDDAISARGHGQPLRSRAAAAAEVAFIRGSSPGRNPVITSIRLEASRSSPPNVWVNAPAFSLQPCSGGQSALLVIAVMQVSSRRAG